MSSNAILIARLALSLQESIVNKDFDNKSPILIIAKGMEILNEVPELMGTTKKQILIEAIERIASGKDGILGTDDDVLSVAHLGMIKILIDNNLIGGLIDVIADASKGKFNIAKVGTAAATCVPQCFQLFFAKKQCSSFT